MRPSMWRSAPGAKGPSVPTCTKVYYPSRRLAAFALRSIQQSTPAGRKTPQGLYRCEFCRSFHLTSNPRARTNRWTISLEIPISATG